MNEPHEAKPEVAFYYPGHVWQSGDWIKNLLLFFDGVGLLVPAHKQLEPEIINPEIATPLLEQGYLHILQPETLVDRKATEKLAEAMTDVIASGRLDGLAVDEAAFDTISQSRFGYSGDPGLADMIFQELKVRGLARDSEDGLSIPLHPMVRYLVLVLLAQILRSKGHEVGLDLSPVTDRSDVVEDLAKLITVGAPASRGQVIALDAQTVGVDLSAVPIDEVLDFRKQNLARHRTYARAVRRFVRQLSPMSDEERCAEYAARQSEIKKLAKDLACNAREAWRLPTAFALGIAGAAWTWASGDPLGAILAGGAALAVGPGAPKVDTGAYSYLFAARERYT